MSFSLIVTLTGLISVNRDTFTDEIDNKKTINKTNTEQSFFLSQTVSITHVNIDQKYECQQYDNELQSKRVWF